MSAIDPMLSDRERLILNSYRSPESNDMRRMIRLSIQYALGAGLFVYFAIHDNPLWSLAVYAIFLGWMVIRLVGAKGVVGVMPGIIEKYEARIKELESLVQAEQKGGI